MNRWPIQLLAVGLIAFNLTVIFDVDAERLGPMPTDPFPSIDEEPGPWARMHWHRWDTMRGPEYWDNPPVTSDVRDNLDGTYSITGEAPVSVALVLHPDWYPEEPWRKAIGWLRQAELMYRNSGVSVRFVIESIETWDEFPDTVERAYNYMSFDRFIGRADLLIGLKPVMAGDPYCGVAGINGAKSVSSCSPITLAHELGHNFGLHHAHRGGYEGRKGYCMTPSPEARDCDRGTIMSYAGQRRVPLFAADGFTYKGQALGNTEHTAVEFLRSRVVGKALRNESGEQGGFDIAEDVALCGE